MSRGIASPPIRVASSDAIWNVEIPRADLDSRLRDGLAGLACDELCKRVLVGFDLGRDAGQNRLSFVARAYPQTLERADARDNGFLGERLVRLDDAADLVPGPRVTDGMPRAILDAA